MDRSEQIALYDACNDAASTLRGLIFHDRDLAEHRGDTDAAQRLMQQVLGVNAELRAIDPDNEPQMRDSLSKWGQEISRLRAMPATA
jgi:hypothetical protein